MNVKDFNVFHNEGLEVWSLEENPHYQFQLKRYNNGEVFQVSLVNIYLDTVLSSDYIDKIEFLKRLKREEKVEDILS